MSEQNLRITHMERILDDATRVMDELEKNIEEFQALQAKIQELDVYYTSPQWRADFEADEAGLLAFCEHHSWPVRFFTADELCAAEGSFSPSDFVRETVGVDNVCERSAVCAADGALFEKKYASDGVTFALAVTQAELNWSW